MSELGRQRNELPVPPLRIWTEGTSIDEADQFTIDPRGYQRVPVASQMDGEQARKARGRVERSAISLVLDGIETDQLLLEPFRPFSIQVVIRDRHRASHRPQQRNNGRRMSSPPRHSDSRGTVRGGPSSD